MNWSFFLLACPNIAILVIVSGKGDKIYNVKRNMIPVIKKEARKINQVS